MRLVVSRRPPEWDAPTRWESATATSSLDGFPGVPLDRHQATVELHPGEEPDVAFERVRGRLFAYDVFPPTLMRFVMSPTAPIRSGTLIVQRVGFGPFRFDAAVRVVETWDLVNGDERDAGFRYVTLAGHPERGMAAFRVRRDSSGPVTVHLEARSVVGSLLTRLGRPVARLAQLAATRAALRRLASGTA